MPDNSYTHKSDCAVHNEPALRNGPCDCGFTPTHDDGREPTDTERVDWMEDYVVEIQSHSGGWNVRTYVDGRVFRGVTLRGAVDAGIKAAP